jgi:hypothetical protein
MLAGNDDGGSGGAGGAADAASLLSEAAFAAAAGLLPDDVRYLVSHGHLGDAAGGVRHATCSRPLAGGGENHRTRQPRCCR